MHTFFNLIRNLYINNRTFYALFGLVAFFVLAHFVTILFIPAQILFLVFILAVFVDIFRILLINKAAISVHRRVDSRLSNGDENPVKIVIENHTSVYLHCRMIDEIPPQFQVRNLDFTDQLPGNSSLEFNYSLRPVYRGVYQFGSTRLFISSRLGLVRMRITYSNAIGVKVYPSFVQMRRYEIMAISDRLKDVGIKKIRKISQNQEFEQIRDYVQGDDYRTVNWKATARRASLMVNQYQDEKSQHVYSVIDMGRTMKMPFNGLSLLDYAINASLVISNIALYKQDKPGLITFSKSVDSLVLPSRNRNQLFRIIESLYQQKTGFPESNFEALYHTIYRQTKQRSLLLLYTNFEGISSAIRQIPYFKKLAQKHLLVVIFFENSEMNRFIRRPASSLKTIYERGVAQQFILEKRQIVQELRKFGIQAIITEPEQLNVAVINKYLELKSLGLI